MNNKVQLIFWDVQHGNATFIRTPNNRTVLIDLGTGDYSGKDLSFSPLLHLQKYYGLTQIDYLVITHPHLDHIDDIININLFSTKVFNRPRQLTNEEVLKDVQQKDRAKFQKYCDLNSSYTIDITGGTNDENIVDNYGGMKMIFFSPLSCSHDNFNNHSIITIIEYAGIKIVIPGDNQECSFQELMQQNSFKTAVKDSHVLLAAHHGRESGFNNEFVTLVNPLLSVVSDGELVDSSANNRYSQKSQGWTVSKKDGTSGIRKCLSTNNDGEVFVNFGFSEDPNYKNFLQVIIN
jgi:beta-lactamase superfamily II metal-dependent hydrolase